jgi:hypothetical protein
MRLNILEKRFFFKLMLFYQKTEEFDVFFLNLNLSCSKNASRKLKQNKRGLKSAKHSSILWLVSIRKQLVSTLAVNQVKMYIYKRLEWVA